MQMTCVIKMNDIDYTVLAFAFDDKYICDFSEACGSSLVPVDSLLCTEQGWVLPEYSQEINEVEDIAMCGMFLFFQHRTFFGIHVISNSYCINYF